VCGRVPTKRSFACFAVAAPPLGHPPAAAGGAEAAALAREGNQAVELAVVAAQAQEAVREDAAPEVGAKLLFDEAGTGLVASARVCEEGLELLAHDLVQEGLLGAAGCVAVWGYWQGCKGRSS